MVTLSHSVCVYLRLVHPERKIECVRALKRKRRIEEGMKRNRERNKREHIRKIRNVTDDKME
jgi:hypothetical protein